MIGEAFFGLLFFFLVLGLLHSQEEVEIENRQLPAAPAFHALALYLPLAVFVALLAPAIGALLAVVFEKMAVALHVKAVNDSLTITYTNRPPSGGSFTFNYDWLSVVFILAAGIGPLASYYAGYNLGNWLTRKELIPILIRYPLVVVEEPEVIRVEVVPQRRRRARAGEKEEEEYVLLKGDLF
jgi:hypothetical protein